MPFDKRHPPHHPVAVPKHGGVRCARLPLFDRSERKAFCKQNRKRFCNGLLLALPFSRTAGGRARPLQNLLSHIKRVRISSHNEKPLPCRGSCNPAIRQRFFHSRGRGKNYSSVAYGATFPFKGRLIVCANTAGCNEQSIMRQKGIEKHTVYDPKAARLFAFPCEGRWHAIQK